MSSNISSKINTGISKPSMNKIVNLLNKDLADEYVLLIKTKNYHWNVVDPRFNDLHKFLDEQYHKLIEMVDELAERNRSVGGKAIGTLKEFLQQTRLSEQPNQYPKADKMLENLLLDHESIIRQLRKDLETCDKLGDMGTSDFLTGVMEEHEKMAWMLRSFLES